MEHVIVLDLDGAVADNRWRRRMIKPEGTHPDIRWKFYHERCGEDEAVNGRVWKGNRCLIVTSRPEQYRKQTESWLARNNFRLAALLMRPDGNYDDSPTLKKNLIEDYWDSVSGQCRIACAYDDREDVIEMYRSMGITARRLCLPGGAPQAVPETKTSALAVPDRLRAMADIYEQRNAQYDDNFEQVGPMTAALFPEGISAEVAASPKFHLYILALVKISRLAKTDLKHLDSAEDLGVYAAMIAELIKEECDE